ncbi:hypothetical protein GDO78_015401 [Eleutherodactylus coqui]|uniref:Uncharacterized protein n=1 Tax=Eleutherodactylus coqui TaxID=57060 RepID=A0A8J6EDU0_ELECQ|nr:hypothetical protein GDO78_015401 [Eleutherodactylus coqui]
MGLYLCVMCHLGSFFNYKNDFQHNLKNGKFHLKPELCFYGAKCYSAHYRTVTNLGPEKLESDINPFTVQNNLIYVLIILE